MKASELRELSVEELQDRETELAERLFTYRVQRVTGQLEKPSKMREAKRDLARVLTVLNEKRAAAAEKATEKATEETVAETVGE